MSCLRCGGFVQWQRVYWRSQHMLRACLVCGDRTDEVILVNRHWQAIREQKTWKTTTWDRIRLLVAKGVSTS